MTKRYSFKGRKDSGDLFPYRGVLPASRNQPPNAVGSRCGLRFLFQSTARAYVM